MVIAALPDAETASIVGTLMFAMCMIFNGVLQTPAALPGFWDFMYRVSPFTYIIDGIVATALHDRRVVCAANELSVFDPPANLTCGQYLQSYLQAAPGSLHNPAATTHCEYCALTVADQYLEPRGIVWSLRWRNFGLVWAYVVFNLFMIPTLYYVFRVRRWGAKPTRKLGGSNKDNGFGWLRTWGRHCRLLLTGRKEKLALEKGADDARVY